MIRFIAVAFGVSFAGSVAFGSEIFWNQLPGASNKEAEALIFNTLLNDGHGGLDTSACSYVDHRTTVFTDPISSTASCPTGSFSTSSQVLNAFSPSGISFSGSGSATPLSGNVGYVFDNQQYIFDVVDPIVIDADTNWWFSGIGQSGDEVPGYFGSYLWEITPGCSSVAYMACTHIDGGPLMTANSVITPSGNSAHTTLYLHPGTYEIDSEMQLLARGSPLSANYQVSLNVLVPILPGAWLFPSALCLLAGLRRKARLNFRRQCCVT